MTIAKKACAFNTYFASVGRHDNNILPPVDICCHSVIDSVRFCERDVLAAINKLKNNFTLGPDGFPPIFLNNLNTPLLYL